MFLHENKWHQQAVLSPGTLSCMYETKSAFPACTADVSSTCISQPHPLPFHPHSGVNIHPVLLNF